MMTLHDDRQMGLDVASHNGILPNAYGWMDRNHLNLALKLCILFAESFQSMSDEMIVLYVSMVEKNIHQSTIDLSMVKENAIGF